MARSTLTRIDAVGGLPLVYEENDREQAFAVDPGFAERLEAWLGWWRQHSPTTAPDRIRTFGTWIDGGRECSSWHHAGRAFDLTALERDGEVTHWGRMDRVEGLPIEQQPDARRRYWQLVAGLSLHFADLLTHLFDDAHRNHLHLDNGRSGSGDAVFTGRSRIQTLTVQAVCTEVFGVPTALSGSYDRATRTSVATVTDPLGVGADLREDAVWRAFCTAAVTT